MADNKSGGILGNIFGGLLSSIFGTASNAVDYKEQYEYNKKLMEDSAKTSDEYQRRLMADQYKLQKSSLLAAGFSPAAIGDGFGSIANSNASPEASVSGHSTAIDLTNALAQNKLTTSQAKLADKQADLVDAQTQTENESRDGKVFKLFAENEKIQHEIDQIDQDIKNKAAEEVKTVAETDLLYKDYDLRFQLALANIEKIKAEKNLTDSQVKQAVATIARIQQDINESISRMNVNAAQAEQLKAAAAKLAQEELTEKERTRQEHEKAIAAIEYQFDLTANQVEYLEELTRKVKAEREKTDSWLFQDAFEGLISFGLAGAKH